MEEQDLRERIKPAPEIPSPEPANAQKENQGHIRNLNRKEDGGNAEKEIKTCYESELDKKIIRYTFFPRLVLSSLWLLSQLYAYYRMFLATEKAGFIKTFPEMSPGIFTNLTGRGKDNFDTEWTIYTQHFMANYILWVAFYALMARVIQLYVPKLLPIFSTTLSFFMLAKIIGLPGLALLLLQVVSFWFVQRLNSKAAIWLNLFLLLYFMQMEAYEDFFPIKDWYGKYYLHISSAWNLSRCLSFYFDIWNRPNRASISALISCTHFCFYFPFSTWGPFEYFEKFETNVLLAANKQKTITRTLQDIKTLVLKLARAFVRAVCLEFVLHYLYFRLLSHIIPILEGMDLWVVSAVVSILGMFMHIKYLIFYGVGVAIAEADGLPPLPLPACVNHFHRYSLIWKNFDRGLYNFLIRYIYVPTMNYLKACNKTRRMSAMVQQFIGSFSCFVYIYAWHNGTFPILIWTVVNFIAITIERFGGFMKRKIDHKYKIPQAVWDAFIEPIVTVPLITMSVITSCMFNGSFSTFQHVFDRALSGGIWFVMPFLFCFTNCGVLIRTWSDVRLVLIEKN